MDERKNPQLKAKLARLQSAWQTRREELGSVRLHPHTDISVHFGNFSASQPEEPKCERASFMGRRISAGRAVGFSSTADAGLEEIAPNRTPPRGLIVIHRF